MQSGHRDTTAFKTQQTPQNHRYLASNLRSKLQRPAATRPPPPFLRRANGHPGHQNHRHLA